MIVDSTVEQPARIVVDRDGKPFKTVLAQLHRGKTAVIVQDSVADAGFHRYRASLEVAHDTDPRNNLGLGFVAVRGKPKLLVLQEKPQEPTLASALRRAGITVEVRGPGQLPNRVDELQDYDAVILNDFNAEHLLPQQMEMLRTASQDSGIGLAMIGGENSFLPGGYQTVRPSPRRSRSRRNLNSSPTEEAELATPLPARDHRRRLRSMGMA